MPFIFVRTLYSVLSAFSPAPTFGQGAATASSHNSLSKFNSITGEWQLFLGMSIMMEFLVVIMYLGCGLLFPIPKDADYKVAAGEEQQELAYQYGA